MSAYRSVGTTNIVQKDGAAWSLTITKPSGLTVGDYMVAVIGTSSNSAVQDVSGWTSLGSQLQGADARLTLYGKTADSSDTSATDFTFAVHSGNGGSGDGMGGCIIAVSGTQPVTSASFIDFGTDNDGGTMTYSGGITPSVANSILIMATFGHGSIAGTVSNYAIATDNPTWTERFDDTQDVSTEDYIMAVATAPRSQTTATGDFSLDYSVTGYSSAGALIAVLEAQSTTQTPAVITATATIQEPAVSGGSNTSPAVITATASVIDPTVTTPDPMWANQTKNSTSWANQTKN